MMEDKKKPKPPVFKELRKEWLRRVDVGGETPPKIVEDTHYDIRTVRKQLDIARREQEEREAKGQVLRNALEEHYRDLCNVAKSIDSNTDEESPWQLSLEVSNDRLYRALKEHLPRSPLWRRLEKWRKLATDYKSTVEAFIDKVENYISTKKLKLQQNDHDTGYSVFGILRGIISNCKSFIQGHPSLVDSQQVYTLPGKAKYPALRMYEEILAQYKPEEFEEYNDTISELLDEAVKWDDYLKLLDIVKSLRDLSVAIKDELAIITLRRIVPGKCRYCPL